MALVLEVLLDNKGAVHGIKQLGGEVEKLAPAAKKTSTSIVSSFNVIKGFIAGAVVASVISLSREFANLASTSVETSNKFNTLFKNVRNINTAVVQLSKESGYASSSIQTFIADLGALIKPAGFSAEKAFELSKNIAKLSLDIGSFHNYAPQQVMEDFRSALAGSSETLEKYGINVKEGSIAVEAYKMGLTKSIKEYEKLDAVTKQNIRTQALISKAYKDAKDAIGDLAKTQDTYANQQRILDENMKEAGERLGTLVLPFFTQLAKVTNQTLDAWMKIVNIQTDAEMRAEAEKQLNVLENYVSTQDELIENAKKQLGISGKITEQQRLLIMSKVSELKAAADQAMIESKTAEYISERTGRAYVLKKNYNEIHSTITGSKIQEELTLDIIKKQTEELKKYLGITKEINADPGGKTAGIYQYKAKQQVIITEAAQQENDITSGILNNAKLLAVEMPKVETSFKGLVPNGKKIAAYTNAWQVGTEKVNEKLSESMRFLHDIGETFKSTLGRELADAVMNAKSLKDTMESIFSSMASMAIQKGIEKILDFAMGGFQHGGTFTVGGGSGQDSRLVAFRATPGERVTVSPPGQSVTNNSSANINLNFPNVTSVDEYTVRRVIIPIIQREVANRGVRLA